MAKGLYEKWQKPENLTLLQGWRRDGLSMQQIADNIGVKRQTLYDWCTKYKDISDALKKGTEVSNYEVENAMFKSAVGFYVTEVDQTEVQGYDEEGNPRTTVTKHQRRRFIPPNLGAQIFILKNRLPKKWRDKQAVEIDTTALDKLDAILAESRRAAESNGDDELEYITEDEVQQETTGVHSEGEQPMEL